MSQKDSQTTYRRFDSEKIELFDTEDPPSYALKTIRLNQGVTLLNFTCSQIHLILNVFGFSVATSLQPLILLDSNYYNISQDAAGRLTSLILILQLLMKMSVSLIYGHFCDKFGRRAMIYYGACSYLISCFIVPTQDTIFPGFIIGKLLLTNGSSAIGSVQLAADYIHDESKGKAVGISAFLVSISALLANLYLKVLFYNNLSLGTCYAATGTFVFIALIINTFGLKGGRYYLLNNPKFTSAETKSSFKERLKEAISIFSGNGWLIIGLILQITASSDFYIFFTFLLLYVKSLSLEDSSGTTFNVLINNLQTVVILPGILCNFLYGYFLDRKNKPLQTAMVALMGSAVASLLTCFVYQPYDWKIFVSALLLGSTVPGLFIISMYLSIKHVPSDKRGIMLGFKSILGDIGYFLIASGGGLLYDYWRKDGPFIACTILLTLVLFLVIGVHRKMLPNE